MFHRCSCWQRITLPLPLRENVRKFKSFPRIGKYNLFVWNPYWRQEFLPRVSFLTSPVFLSFLLRKQQVYSVSVKKSNLQSKEEEEFLAKVKHGQWIIGLQLFTKRQSKEEERRMTCLAFVTCFEKEDLLMMTLIIFLFPSFHSSNFFISFSLSIHTWKNLSPTTSSTQLRGRKRTRERERWRKEESESLFLRKEGKKFLREALSLASLSILIRWQIRWLSNLILNLFERERGKYKIIMFEGEREY